MKPILALLIISTVGAAQARRISWDGGGDNYWNRGFGTTSAAETHNVTLRVKSIEAAFPKVEAMMAASGGSMHGSGNTYTNNYNGSNLKYRQSSWLMPLKAAEKAAKKAFDLGELVNYSMNRSTNDQKAQVDERVAQLKSELSENKATLEKMPAATYFLTSKLDQLKKVQESYETSASKGQVSVTLQEEASKP